MKNRKIKKSKKIKNKKSLDQFLKVAKTLKKKGVFPKKIKKKKKNTLEWDMLMRNLAESVLSRAKRLRVTLDKKKPKIKLKVK